MSGSVPAHGPTPHPAVNALLGALLSSVEEILDDRLVGMYLYGSLATGGFDAQQSDIDFVVVTAAELHAEVVEHLAAMHARLASGGLKSAVKLEGAYVPRGVLRRPVPDHPPCLTVNEGRFYLARLGSDWIIQRHVLREHGVVVAGPPPDTLIDPVSSEDLRCAVRGFLREWWQPMLEKPDPRLQGTEYQSYAVLTMCRALYTLRYGTVPSKSEAAKWAERTLAKRWSALVAWARERHGDSEPESVEDVLDFIRYALVKSERDEPSL